MAQLQRITPFLWFDGQAEAAANFYVSIFPDSRIVSIAPLAEGPAKGSAIVEFVLSGQQFTALDGGPMFQFSPAISFVVHCENQEEIDHYWERLSENGVRQPCGWVQDQFGVSWQTVPVQLGALLAANGAEVMQVLLTMERIDLSRLESAARGE